MTPEYARVRNLVRFLFCRRVETGAEQKLPFVGWYRAGVRALAVVAMLLTAIMGASVSALAQDAVLTPAEREWLTSHTVLRVGVLRNWPPMSYVDLGGDIEGISPMIIRALGDHLGMRVQFVTGERTELYQQLLAGKIDVLSDISPEENTDSGIMFTSSYLSVPYAIVARKGEGPFRRADDLQGHHLAMEVGVSGWTWFQKHYPDMVITACRSTEDCLEMVARGDVDAYVGNRAVASYMIVRSVLHNLSVQGLVERAPSTLALGVRRDNVILSRLLQHGLNAIDGLTLQTILAQWGKSIGVSTEIGIPLSDAEQQWLDAHDRLTVAVETGNPPFNFYEDNHPSGLSVDFLDRIARTLGISFRYVGVESTEKALDMLKSGAVQIVPGMTGSPSLPQGVSLTQPYAVNPSVLISRDNGQKPRTLADLGGHVIAVEHDPALTRLLRSQYPDVKIVPIERIADGINLVKNGKVNAVLGHLGSVCAAFDRTREDLGLAVALPSGLMGEQAIDLRLAVSQSENILLGILKKSINAFPADDMDRLQKTWLPLAAMNSGASNAVVMNSLEQLFVKDHPSLTLGLDPSWEPFEFVDDGGTYSGLSADVVEQVAAKSGLSFVPQKNLTWAQMMEEAKSGAIDVIPMIQPTKERLKYLDFTRPYVSYPIVILTRDNAPFISGVEALEGLKTGVVDGYSIQGFLHQDYPRIKLQPQPSIEVMLQRLSSGVLDAAVANVAVATSAIDRLKLDNLKIAAPTGYTNDLAMAVPKGQLVLRDILQKSLNAIPEDKLSEMRNRWVALKVEFGVSIGTILLYAAPIGAAIVIVLIIILLWNRKLNREVEIRKQAEQQLSDQTAELQHQRDLLTVVMESMTVGIVAFDDKLQLIACNKPFLRIRDYPQSFATFGTSFQKFMEYDVARKEFGPGDPEEQFQHMVLRAQRFEPHSLERQRPNGRYIEIRGGPVAGGGFVSTFSDITDRKELEFELREARDRAESGARTKSAFLAAMSHEIRTPMNGIIGMIDLLRETPLDADQAQMLGTVRDSSFALLQILNDVLDFSKIEAGKMAIEAIPVSLRDTIEGVVATMVITAVAKNVHLRVFIDPDIPHWVIGDHVRLRQILFNLLGNAIKFTQTSDQRQGVIWVRNELEGIADDGRVRLALTVSDNGIGMSQAVLSKLFQPFLQGESSTTRRFGGTGLGLSICKNLVDLMGGTITVQSEEHVGSTFTVRMDLPVAHGTSPPADEPDLKGVRVLFVGVDNTMQDCLIRYVVARHGTCSSIHDPFAVTQEVADGRRAVDPIQVIVYGPDLDRNVVDVVRRSVVTEQSGTGSGPCSVVLSFDQRERTGLIADDLVVVNARPLARSQFLHALGMACGRCSPEISEQTNLVSAAAGKAPSRAEAIAQHALVLIVEDNPTNRDVLRRQLSVLGYACDLCNNGREGLDAWKSGLYGLILTDCHMPEMDGYQLTETIRAEELKQGDGVRIPIIAISANALQGEGERCLASGMDDYVAKPVEMAQLKRILNKWLPAARPALTSPADDVQSPAQGNRDTEPLTSAQTDVIDLSYLKETFGDDQETISEILQEFVTPSERIVEEIHAAVRARDAAGVKASAHKLKSSSRAIGALSLSDLCLSLEMAGRNSDWPEIDRCHDHLDSRMETVFSYISQF